MATFQNTVMIARPANVVFAFLRFPGYDLRTYALRRRAADPQFMSKASQRAAHQRSA